MDDDYRRISNLFTMAWKHSTPLPTIRHIFYVAHQSADALAHLSRFSNYSNKVGNTQLMFHGTTRSRGCTLRLPPASSSTASSLADVVGASGGKFELCVRGDCNLCSIIRGSYDIEKAKSARMFGTGIYSTNVSSKADIYARAGAFTPFTYSSTKRLKSVILNHVVLGRTELMLAADQSLQHAPGTHNSVTGATTAQGGVLQYHEAVVYREDAMCASAVIFYE